MAGICTGNVREFGFWPLADKLVERVREQQDAETGRADSSAAASGPGKEAASSSVPDAALKAEPAKTGANVSGDLPRPHVKAAKPADPGEREGGARGPDFSSAESGEAWKETREKRPFNQEVELRGGGLNTGSVADFGRPPDSGHITLRNPTILAHGEQLLSHDMAEAARLLLLTWRVLPCTVKSWKMRALGRKSFTVCSG